MKKVLKLFFVMICMFIMIYFFIVVYVEEMNIVNIFDVNFKIYFNGLFK